MTGLSRVTRGRSLAAATTLTILVVGSAVAQPAASPPELEAAFLLNVVKFAEWPSVPDDVSLVVCVVGDDRVARALQNSLRHPSGSAERVQTWRLASEAPSRGCHLMFIAASELRHAAPILDTVRGHPVVTVSDAAAFAESGGMIQLFVEAGRMRFAVNVDAVQRAHVRLSSQLLGLAKIVRDDHDR
jgi:hypothetical protein